MFTLTSKENKLRNHQSHFSLYSKYVYRIAINLIAKKRGSIKETKSRWQPPIIQPNIILRENLRSGIMINMVSDVTKTFTAVFRLKYKDVRQYSLR